MNSYDVAVAFWRKSTWSNNEQGECVEAGPLRPGSPLGGRSRTSRAVAVRDSKDPDGPKLSFNRAQWGNLLDGLKG